MDLNNSENFYQNLEFYQLLPNVEMVVAIFDNQDVILQQPYKVGKINELSKTVENRCKCVLFK